MLFVQPYFDNFCDTPCARKLGFFYQTVPPFVNYSRSAPLLRKNPVVPPFTPQYPPFSDTNWPTQDGAIHNGAS
jgi:hypothetical protein